MRISYPWLFSTCSINVHMALRSPIEIPIMHEKYRKPFIKNWSDEVMISFSKMKSSINEVETILLNEVMFKYKTRLDDKFFYDPIITYVNHEYSLLRGYFMGFEKRMAEIVINNNEVKVSSNDFDLDISYELLDDISSTIPSYPYITYTDFTIPNNVSYKKIGTLEIKNYSRDIQKNVYIPESNLNCLFNLLNLTYKDIIKTTAFYCEENFNIVGINSLNLSEGL